LTEESADPHHPTIFDRVFKPDTGSTLYHYCSTPTFLSILQNGALRFSDANMMNDSEEGRYGYRLFERAANELLEQAKKKPSLEGLEPDFFDRLDACLSPKQLHSHPVIACFSKAPDVLSQWRAYAQEGKGWAVGFDGGAIDAMPVTLFDVLYDPDQQLEEVRNSLAAIYFLWREQGGDFEAAVGSSARLLSSLMLAYKHPSFHEEQEVRALHELRVELAEDGWLLIDEGGTASGKEVEGQPVQFRADGASIVAYVDVPLERAARGTIPELWLGPGNLNGPGNALYPLTQFGHRNVVLRWSASSYRG
jgi:hypothetical protein